MAISFQFPISITSEYDIKADEKDMNPKNRALEDKPQLLLHQTVKLIAFLTLHEKSMSKTFLKLISMT